MGCVPAVRGHVHYRRHEEPRLQTDLASAPTEMPLFSVLVPLYNRASVLPRALDSLLLQDLQDIEVVIVDDGSTDDSLAVANRWAQEQGGAAQRIKVISQENQGAASARNTAFINCSGDFVQFLDSDDSLAPRRLRRLHRQFVSDPSLDFIHTDFTSVCEVCGFENYHPVAESQTLMSKALRGRLWPNTLRSAFRRSLVEASGLWRTDMSCFEDYWYVVRALGYARNSRAIGGCGATAYRGGGAHVSDTQRTQRGRACRIQCEEQLYETASRLSELRPADLTAFRSRIYALSLRSRASGWHREASQALDLAESIDAPLDLKGEQRRLIARSGRAACRAYTFLGSIKRSGVASVGEHRCVKVASGEGAGQG